MSLRKERLRLWHKALLGLRGGSRPEDIMSVEFLEIALDAARCVGCIATSGETNGTGFLVGQDLVLTNQHVLSTAGVAAASELRLDFVENTFGDRITRQTFGLDPARFFAADDTLDYALVAVKPRSEEDHKPLSAYGFKPLIAAEGKLVIAEAVNVIQHPMGKPKRIAIRNNQLVDLFLDDPARPPFFHYTTATAKGSSGSPVFNDQWEVVALHHSAVPKTDIRGRLLDAHGKLLGRNPEDDQIVWVANEGIRVSRLVAHLQRRDDLAPAMATIREDLLAFWNREGTPEAQLRSVLHRRHTSPAIVGSPGAILVSDGLAGAGATSDGEEPARVA